MKILLVDDHVLFREGVALLLRPLVDSAEILEAGTCEEAFARIDEHRDVDLVLMDLGLPGMPGLDGIAVLRERYPEIPVVALSSTDDRGTVLQALDLGAMGFIPKSSSSNVLAGALQLIMAKGVYLPPAVFLSANPLSAERRPASNPQPGTAQKKMTPADLGLTPRQGEVLYLILQGKPTKIICRDLNLSPSTIKVHTSAVLRALNVTTRTQAVIAAGKLGLVF